MRRGGLLALTVVLGACLPGTAVAADSLQVVGPPTVDRAGSLFPDDWAVTDTGAVFDQPGYRGDYTWSIPASIPPSGANATLTLKATDKSGGRFYPAMGLHTNLFVEGGPLQLDAAADKNAGVPTHTVTRTFKLTPGSYCDTCPITVMIGLQSGPRITWTYKVVPRPKGKPCKPGSVTRIAQFNGPLLCHTDEPAPGETGRVSSPVIEPKARTLSVDVTSSAGSLSGTTLVGEAEARKRSADKIGTAVAACYLIGSDAFDYTPRQLDVALGSLFERGQYDPGKGAAARLRNCIALARKLVELFGDAASARAAASGCRVRRIALAGRKLAKGQRPSSSGVRYGCKRVRGGVKITVKRRQGLRAAIGRRLDLGIVRDPDAPAGEASLSFRFR
jgi:hypothetical protein